MSENENLRIADPGSTCPRKTSNARGLAVLSGHQGIMPLSRRQAIAKRFSIIRIHSPDCVTVHLKTICARLEEVADIGEGNPITIHPIHPHVWGPWMVSAVSIFLFASNLEDGKQSEQLLCGVDLLNGLRVWDVGLRVEGLGSRVWGLGYGN